MSERMTEQMIKLYAACTRASIRMAGMQSKNLENAVQGRPGYYKEAEFLKVIEEEGIEHNQVIQALYEN